MLKLDRNNLQSYCRTCLECLHSTPEAVTASSENYNIRKTPNLTKLLILCTTLNINEDTDAAYPQQVCLKCYMSLQEIQRFRDLALQSNEVLRGIVENTYGVVITPTELNTEHEQPTKPKCEDANDHFEASQTQLSESYFVSQEKESEYDEFLDNNREIKIDVAMFDNELCVNPAEGVDAKIIDCSAETVDRASTSTAAAKRKRVSDDGDTATFQCPGVDCKVEFKTKNALETHVKYVHGAEMPGNYWNLKVPDAENLCNSIKMVLIDKQSKCGAAAACGMVTITFRRHLDKVMKHFPTLEGVTDDDLLAFVEGNIGFSGGSVFSPIREKELVRYIISCAKMNYGLRINNIRFLAYNFAVKIDLKIPASWAKRKMATKAWSYTFLRRHPNLKLLKPEPTSDERSKGFCKEAVHAFFSNLQEAIAKAPAIFDPTRVWNMDEIGLPTVPTNAVLVVAQKDSIVGRFSSAERGTNVTMAVAVSAAGKTIPPMFLFARKNMESVFLDNAPPGSIGYANVSGWMDTDHFILYMKHFIKHTSAAKTNPLLLIMDNDISHISIEVVDLCVANGIEVVTLPRHCSRHIQPLDVSVFGPFKRAFTLGCMEWCMSHVGRVLKIHHMPGLADKAMMQAVTQRNIRSGFEATGIYPLNASIFIDADLEANISGESLMAEDVPNMLVVRDNTDVAQ